MEVEVVWFNLTTDSQTHLLRFNKEACTTGALVPRMRRLRDVAGSSTYNVVCDQLATLLSSHCFALLPTRPRRIPVA
jgi:hypothetical protein